MGIIRGLSIPGSAPAVIKVQRGFEDGGQDGRDAVSRSYHLWTVDKKNVTFWEYFDEEALRLSIAETGRAVGIGRCQNDNRRVQQKTAHEQGVRYWGHARVS